MSSKIILKDHSSLSVAEYDTRFHELARHVAMLMPTKHKRVRIFVRGLSFPL